MPRTAAIVVAFTLAIAACGGSNEATEPTATPSPTVVIELSPTAAPTAQPTEVPEASPSSQPAVVAEPDLSNDEQAVIAAWEKYLRLRTKGRGKDPSAAAVDYESYITDPLLKQVRQTDEEDLAADRYLIGTVTSLRPKVQIEEGATFSTLADCLDTRLDAKRLSDGEPAGSQSDLIAAQAQARKISGTWLISGQETGGPCINA